MPEKEINKDQLKKGMYVILDSSWFSHPFLTNEFKIESEEQIQKFDDLEVNTIKIDPDKSDVTLPLKQEDKSDDRTEIETPDDWNPEKLISEDFKKVIHDQNMDPDKKAEAVYESSVGIMENLLDNPSSENIEEFREGAADIVDMLLEEDATSHYLLNITSHDYYTYIHSVNVGVYSILLTKALFGDSSNHDLEKLGAGFFLHDIGKTRVDQDIINKRGKLTDEEYRKMKTHPYQGYKILSETEQLDKENEVIVMQHHERYDGTGYPRQLSGDQIHLYGKICCIADVFDALTAKRPYKEPLSSFEALKLMKNEMLDHFQEDMFEKFVLLFKE